MEPSICPEHVTPVLWLSQKTQQNIRDKLAPRAAGRKAAGTRAAGPRSTGFRSVGRGPRAVGRGPTPRGVALNFVAKPETLTKDVGWANCGPETLKMLGGQTLNSDRCWAGKL